MTLGMLFLLQRSAPGSYRVTGTMPYLGSRTGSCGSICRIGMSEAHVSGTHPERFGAWLFTIDATGTAELICEKAAQEVAA